MEEASELGLDPFDQREAFFEELDVLLADSGDDGRGDASVVKLASIASLLDHYQELPYLVDPYLERIVEPVALRLRLAFEQVSRGGTPSSAQVARYCQLLYQVTKLRGYKTTVQYFPHQVTDLQSLLSVFGPAHGGPGGADILSAWQTRYVLLLWLSLVCMIPFNLDRFDDTANARSARQRIREIAMSYLSEPGKEREAAALLLARLVLRQDTSAGFLGAVVEDLRLALSSEGDQPSDFLTTGILQTLAEMVKLGRRQKLLPVVDQIAQCLSLADADPLGSRNTAVRKSRIKLAGRLAVVVLSGPAAISESDVPEEVETIVQDILEALRDEDTIVRWSAAKHLARICVRLPADLRAQVCQAVLDAFSLGATEDAPLPTSAKSDRQLDLLAVSESTWHGTCLACAELLRHAQFPLALISDLVTWALRALHFEQRKGVQNIGSGVRDAAAYIIWSLGRAVAPEAVAGRGQEIGCSLMTAALFDREVHIRRAASAAFQEVVGRLGILPHGIDVLRIADFFTVGLRRSAFLVAAPRVAELPEYRKALLDHLKTVCLRHWDADIRELASQSVRAMATSAPDDLAELIDGFVAYFDELASSAGAGEHIDTRTLHGYLLTLAELASLVKELGRSGLLPRILATVSAIPDSTLKAYSSDPVLLAACTIVEYAFSEQSTSSAPFERIVDYAMKRPNDELHEATRRALRTVTSTGAGLSTLVARGETSLRLGTPTAKRAASCMLGGCSFTQQSFWPRFPSVLAALRAHSKSETSDVETRRNCLSSVAEIVVGLDQPSRSALLPPELLQEIIADLAYGLGDYASDQRGDVGSWVRLASLTSLSRVIVHLCDVEPNPVLYLPPSMVSVVIGKMVKQTLDRIDSLREGAWNAVSETVLAVQARGLGDAASVAPLASSFDPSTREQWRDLRWTFPRSLALLRLGCEATEAEEAVNENLIEGIVLLLGGKGNSETRKAADSAAAFCGAVQPAALVDLVSRVTAIAELRVKEPKLVLMALESLAGLLEAGALDALPNVNSGPSLLRRVLAVAMRGLAKPKPMTRLTVAVRIVVSLTRFEALRLDTVKQLGFFLSNPTPRIRSLAAETLYTQLQTDDVEMPEACESALLETDWAGAEEAAWTEATGAVVGSLSRAWSAQ